MKNCKASLREKYLSKTTILPFHIKEDMRVVELVDGYGASGAFNAGRLSEACKLFLRMAREGTTIGLTLSGAMTPTGMGGILIPLMERGLIDFVISTGANLYHDLHFALDLSVYQGDFRVDDTELHQAKIVRIYDMFLTEEVLFQTDDFVKSVMDSGTGLGAISSAQLHYLLGKKALETTPHPERSFVAQAARLGVPVFTSSPGDSSIGMCLANLRLQGCKATVDPEEDILQVTSIVHSSKKNAVLAVGGGSPKNFYMQTQPMLDMLFRKGSRGHDYFIQITTDSPQWGGLSGATPQEAVSWGKMREEETENHVVVYCDATIAVPILAAYALAKGEKRPLKRLYERLPELVEALKRDSQSP
ncbi:MAG TPA: homospermidine biosynthesis protein [Candidatus Hypogeohydataceae bacterium YC38]